MPIIAAIFGKPDFRSLTFTIHNAVFSYGAFLTDVLQFVAIGAAVFFFIVKPVQLMAARGEGPVEEGTPDEERRHQELLAGAPRTKLDRPNPRARADALVEFVVALAVLRAGALGQFPLRPRRLLLGGLLGDLDGGFSHGHPPFGSGE